MSLKSGFFNSVNHDRTYDAEDMASIFDGAFSDGVFFNVKINGSLENNEHFYVTASGTGVNVGTGKAWFDHTYTLNDEPLFVELDEPEGVLNRIDAVVLEINRTMDVRQNSIKVVKGTPGSSSKPPKPSMVKSTLINQYALAYVYRPAGSETVYQASIENVVGTEETPYAAGLIPMDQNIPFNFGIDGNGKYGYKKVGSSEVTPFTPFRFGIDSDGNYGYYKDGADTVTPFKTGSGGSSAATFKKVATVSSNQTINLINKSGFEELWENLTTSNFFVLINGINVNKPRNTSEQIRYATFDGLYNMTRDYNEITAINVSLDELASNIDIKPSLSYNPDTGNLSITGMSGSASHTSNIIKTIKTFKAGTGGGTREYTSTVGSLSNSLTVSVTIDIWVAY